MKDLRINLRVEIADFPNLFEKDITMRGKEYTETQDPQTTNHEEG